MKVMRVQAPVSADPPPNEAPCKVHYDEAEGADWCFTHNNFAPHDD